MQQIQTFLEWPEAQFPHLQGSEPVKSAKWIWLLVILALLAVAAYFITNYQQERDED